MNSPTPGVPAEWPTEARDWVQSRLNAPIESAERLADTTRSSVMRLESGGHVYFFKSDRSHGPAEAVILARLADRAGEWLAPIVALAEDIGWSLTRDVGPTGLDDASTDDWCRLVRCFGELQLRTTDDVPGWLGVGCNDLRGAALHDAILALLDGARGELDRVVNARLDSLRPRVAQACRDLSTDGLPAALVHRDLVPVNVVLRDGAPVFLDWSDTVVGHPFFGCDRLLDSCWTDHARKQAVIASYLSVFEDLAPPERLRASFDQVLFLRVVYEGVRWADEIAALPADSEAALRLRADALGGLSMMADAAHRLIQ